MGLERELKFSVSADAAAILCASLGLNGQGQAARLRSVYFDTADHRLRQTGLSLRVRSAEGRLTQTLKRLAAVATVREEWETPVDQLSLDGEALAQTPAAGLTGQLASEAKPIFVTDVERRTWRRECEGAIIEIALDDGEITARSRRLPIRELELELKAGEPGGLFALARELAGIAPLRLSLESKAERGWRLAEDTLSEPRRWAKPRLDGAADPVSGFRLISESALAQVGDNLEVLRAVRRPEAVHQARVGLRRLRATQAAFRDLLVPSTSGRIEADLKWLAGELDCARDLDVFARETFMPAARALAPEGLASLGHRLQAARDKAYRRIEAALNDPRLDRLFLETLAWIHDPRSLATEGVQFAPLTLFARQALDHLRKSVRARARGYAKLDSAGRHTLRIRAKRLRYAAEAFAPLFPAHPKRRRQLIEALEAMQSRLGALNDLSVARTRLAPVLGSEDPTVALAVGRVLGWREAGQADLLAKCGKAVKRFVDTKAFWR